MSRHARIAAPGICIECEGPTPNRDTEFCGKACADAHRLRAKQLADEFNAINAKLAKLRQGAYPQFPDSSKTKPLEDRLDKILTEQAEMRRRRQGEALSSFRNDSPLRPMQEPSLSLIERITQLERRVEVLEALLSAQGKDSHARRSKAGNGKALVV